MVLVLYRALGRVSCNQKIGGAGSAFGIDKECKRGVGLVEEQKDFLFPNLLAGLLQRRKLLHSRCFLFISVSVNTAVRVFSENNRSLVG